MRAPRPLAAERSGTAAGYPDSPPRRDAPDPWTTRAGAARRAPTRASPAPGAAAGAIAAGAPGFATPAAAPPAGPPPADRTPADRTPARSRVLPRTLLGITSLILALAVGAAFSGVVLYSYYQYRLDQTNDRVNGLISGYKKQFQNAEGQLAAQTNHAKSQIQAQLVPLQQLQAQANTLTELVKQAGPSLFFVRTQDQNGQPSVGSAFVVASNPTQSLLLTSYTTVAAATRSPAPQVQVQQGAGLPVAVTVRTWDPTYDLALIVLDRGGLPALFPAPPTPAPVVGERVFALSGLGAAGGSVSQGAVTEVSANGIEHNTAISTAYQGGPLLDSSGHVLAVTSRAYAPLGFSSDGVWFAPYLNSACQKVLDCPNGSISSST